MPPEGRSPAGPGDPEEGSGLSPLPVCDFHVHTIHSDGDLGPAELARRAFVKGYELLGISDHVDQSNIEAAIEAALKASRSLSGAIGPVILAGAELTHVPPRQIADMVKSARRLGADYVVVHGESAVEPVAPDTNLAAIEARADILAHPGVIAPEVAKLAAQKGTALEITSRRGHCLGNGLVAALAREFGASLILSSDAHSPSDLLTPELQMATALGAGLSYLEYAALMARVRAWGLGLAKSASLALSGEAPLGPERERA
jgi:histidinol phosphatase-like PHP family hydrolase